MLLYFILFLAALILAGLAAFEIRRGPSLLLAIGLACVALVGVLQTVQHL